MNRLVVTAFATVVMVGALQANGWSQALGVGLRLGGATQNTSGLLLGMDFRVPGYSILPGFRTRLDFDTWGQPTSGWDRTNGGIAATFSQVADVLSVGYIGVGAGYARLRSHGDSHSSPELKLIAGVNILGATVEANYHIGEISTLTGMVRLRF